MTLFSRNEVTAPARMDETRALAGAMAAFSEASERLEARYLVLVSETESLREQLRVKEETIKKNERLATLGQMSAALAHEIRNPLGAIKLFVSLLRDDVRDNSNAAELVAEIERSITRLDDVVGNVLQLSRGHRLLMSPCNVHAIIDDAISHFRALSRGRATIHLSLRASPLIAGTETGIRQVVANLLTNSLQATAYVGTITITTCDSGEYLELVVQDNGPGFPPSLLEHLGEPFMSAKNEGTGLGLAVVRTIVQAHGGTLSASNSGGARVAVTFHRTGRVAADFAAATKG